MFSHSANNCHNGDLMSSGQNRVEKHAIEQYDRKKQKNRLTNTLQYCLAALRPLSAMIKHMDIESSFGLRFYGLSLIDFEQVA